MQFAGKIALVTGASRGIGRAIALRLAQDGAEVAVHYKGNEAAAREVVNGIESAGGRAAMLQADLSNPDEVRALWREFDNRFDGLDILVNNAGWAAFKPLEAVSAADFDAIFDLNVRGLFFNTQEAARRLHGGGRIVNVSSGITRVNAGGGSVYSASKAAVEAFTRCWSAEMAPRQITVNTVSPGMTETDLLMDVTPREVLAAMIAQTPLGRLGQPADIADVVAFLCSDNARWLTASRLEYRHMERLGAGFVMRAHYGNRHIRVALIAIVAAFLAGAVDTAVAQGTSRSSGQVAVRGLSRMRHTGAWLSAAALCWLRA